MATTASKTTISKSDVAKLRLTDADHAAIRADHAKSEAGAAATPSSPSSPFLTLGKFAFTLVENTEPPAPTSAAHVRGPEPLPFAAQVFPSMKHNAEFFLPDSWWTAPKADGGRGLADTFAKSKKHVMRSWVQSKVRDQFRKWRDAETAGGKPNDAPGGVAHDKNLVVAYREKGAARLPSGTYPESGLSMWLQDVPGYTAQRKAAEEAASKKK